MKNWKHTESDLVHYWFGDHFLLLFSPPLLREKTEILIAQPRFLLHDAQEGMVY